jgi:hypothetical protein
VRTSAFPLARSAATLPATIDATVIRRPSRHFRRLLLTHGAVAQHGVKTIVTSVNYAGWDASIRQKTRKPE